MGANQAGPADGAGGTAGVARRPRPAPVRAVLRRGWRRSASCRTCSTRGRPARRRRRSGAVPGDLHAFLLQLFHAGLLDVVDVGAHGLGRFLAGLVEVGLVGGRQAVGVADISTTPGRRRGRSAPGASALRQLGRVMTDSGFSWPSMVPCCGAVATSGQAIGVGRMPIWRKAAMWMGFSVVRIFRPLASAGVLTGRTLLVRWRKPCSPQARAMMPRLGNLASMSWPILLSSTVRACGRSRSRKGISKTPVSGTK